MGLMEWHRGTNSQFSQTNWSMVLTARARESPDSRGALELFCRSYRPPVYAFLRRRGLNSHDAEDLAQSFFVHLLEQPFLENVAPENGRFRSFLLAALEHFRINDWNRARALKRGGGAVAVPLDSPAAFEIPAATSVDAAIFDRAWALDMVNRAFEQLRDECQHAGKAALFEELKSQLLHGDEPVEAPAIAARLGCGTEAIRQARSRLRRRLRELLIAIISETVREPADVEDETRYLISVCATAGTG